MTAAGARAFVRKHGIVLVSAKGPVPTLTEAIAGEPIRGSWWGHPKGKAIFGILEKLGDDKNLVSLKLIDDKLTFVDARLWPALVRAAAVLGRARLAKIGQEHTPTGAHKNVKVAFPKWVPKPVLARAKKLTLEQALAQLGPWADRRKI